MTLTTLLFVYLPFCRIFSTMLLHLATEFVARSF